eukprot:TRINITY_DN12502_c0_g3_i1.p1 TRINITY_DN12502_c0_g3~~TRINITY_DN12502_c0_g3_i1.p1  ORF type:complete len:168 (-),score=6.81 TRINITY_DN12502_c0_g3_i1:50-553(-)
MKNAKEGKKMGSTLYSSKCNKSFDVSVLGTRLTAIAGISKCFSYKRPITQQRKMWKRHFDTIPDSMSPHIKVVRNNFKASPQISITIPKASKIHDMTSLTEEHKASPHKRNSDYNSCKGFRNVSFYGTHKRANCKVSKPLLVKCTNYTMEEISCHFTKRKMKFNRKH